MARLVATGKTNREVAAELLLSVKTVEVHLTRIYAKLGVSSRSQLARRTPTTRGRKSRGSLGAKVARGCDSVRCGRSALVGAEENRRRAMFDRSHQWHRRAGLAGAVVAAAAAVAACGSGTQGDTGGTSGAGGGNVTLTLKHITDNEPAFTKLIAEYKKVAPNVTIKAELRAGRRSADLAARAARRRQRARPVRRLAGQRLGDVGAAARARGRAGGHLRPGRGSRTSRRTCSRCSATTARRTCTPRA